VFSKSKFFILLTAALIIAVGFIHPVPASGVYQTPPPGTIDENGVYWGPPVDLDSAEIVNDRYETPEETKANQKPADAIDVEIYNGELDFDVWPYINKNNRVMIPVRKIAEELQGTVTWDAAKQTVSIHRPAQKFQWGGFKDIDRAELTIELKIGEKSATVNGQTVALDTQAEIKNGRTMVPLRFVAENFGATVEWKAYSKTVSIVYFPDPEYHHYMQ